MIDEKLIPYLVSSIQEFWELPAFTDYPGTALSYKDVGRRMMWLHRRFAEAGVQKGTKIALAGKNCSNWALVWISSVTYGATIVPILANFSPEDTQHIVNHSDAELLFVSKDKYDSLDCEEMRKLRFVVILDDLSLAYCKDEGAKAKYLSYTDSDEFHNLDKGEIKAEDKCDNEDIAAIIYTSGTTGFSKGVMLPHRSLLANLIVARENLLFNVGAKVLAFLPLAHAYACSFDLLYPFTRGNHINFLDRIPAPKILLAGLKDLKPEVVLTVPLLIEKIYKKQLQATIDTPKNATDAEDPHFEQDYPEEDSRQTAGGLWRQCEGTHHRWSADECRSGAVHEKDQVPLHHRIWDDRVRPPDILCQLADSSS
ncbi:MAG: AMP-binding protein [Candidatus Cloacimonetes bacterium]|nr:AMP-binding protein [Candidatus Cloacimonadota bacterium]